MEEGVDSKWKDEHHPPDPVRIISMLVMQAFIWGVRLMIKHN